MSNTVQLATRVDKGQEQRFRDITLRLGTTPADAMRVFVAAFNQRQGFPFDVRLTQDIEAFTTDADATAFATRMATRTIHEAR